MSLRDTIQRATKPVLGFVGRELGDQLTVARKAEVRQRDGSTKDTLNAVVTLVHVRGVVEEVAAVRAQREFGDDTVATGVVTIQTTTAIEQDDVIAVESGHFTGRHFAVEERRYDQFTLSYILGVREVPVVGITGD